MVATLTFAIACLAAIALLGLSLAGLLIDGFRFWPPPDNNAWQYKLFWTLFRVFIFCLVVLCFVDFHRLGDPVLIVSVLGWFLFIVGFGAASLITAQLGWENAHGEAVNLKTDGWFAYSRNPVYVASILGMIGLALAINSVLVGVLLLLWALMYTLAPVTEERWLLERYGNSYEEYCRRVPRFFGRINVG